jgi:hypothetical protein
MVPAYGSIIPKRGVRARSLSRQQFGDNGVNALHVWCQWDFGPPRTFVGAAPDHTLSAESGKARDAILAAADNEGMVVEVAPWRDDRGGRFRADRLSDPPGVSNVLGGDEWNRILDLPMPYTVRRQAGRFQEVAPQIADLLGPYRKPVSNDEPAGQPSSQGTAQSLDRPPRSCWKNFPVHA